MGTVTRLPVETSGRRKLQAQFEATLARAEAAALAASTPVPDLMAQIRDEGGLVSWLSPRTTPDSWDKLTAALELAAAAGAAKILAASRLHPVR